jgi:uncharacterized repeat protein (TIGR01451 family)
MDSNPVVLNYELDYNPASGLLKIGDTVHSFFTVTPITGDLNSADNTQIRIDTVRAGCDPNEMSVNPPSCVSPGTKQLQYTINFENTGNDTAHNIYVMDTLSNNVDPKSLEIVMASATMNISSQKNSTSYNIVRFDFPQINLLDSSHHHECDGSVIFNINLNDGLADGSSIFNHAGIFFDYNPVVMTNTVENVIGCPPLSIASVNIVNDVDIYPNPANDEMTIKMDQETYNAFTITNSMGQIIVRQQLSSSQTNVNVKTFAPGFYYIMFTGDNGTIVKKFVKM